MPTTPDPTTGEDDSNADPSRVDAVLALLAPLIGALPAWLAGAAAISSIHDLFRGLALAYMVWLIFVFAGLVVGVRILRKRQSRGRRIAIAAVTINALIAIPSVGVGVAVTVREIQHPPDAHERSP